jgi:hypothetical protein
MKNALYVFVLCVCLSAVLIAAIDSVEDRRSASGMIVAHPAVTPEVLKDSEWRRQVMGTYSGIPLNQIITDEKRRSASNGVTSAGVVTPNSDKDAQWRIQASGNYSGLIADAVAGGAGGRTRIDISIGIGVGNN